MANENETNEPKRWVSNSDLQLELKALRSDVKLWVLGAVALNQFLASTDIPSSLTGAALGAFALKGVFAAIFRGSA